MTKSRNLLIYILVFIAIFATITFFKEAKNYIAKDYFDSDQFVSEYVDFQVGLEQYVLNELDIEATKDQLTVTPSEIEYYRNYFGALADQIESVKEQYAESLDERDDEAQDQDVIKALKTERDTKIAAIKANFNDDEVVKKKILAAKEEAVDRYAIRWERQKKEWQKRYSYFNYEFQNTETGEKFSHGEINKNAAFTQTFGKNNTVFNSDSVDSSFYTGEYLSDSSGFEDSEIKIAVAEQKFDGKIVIPKSKVGMAMFNSEYKAFNMQKRLYYALWLVGVLSILMLYTVYKPTRSMYQLFPQTRQKFDSWPVDVRIAAWLVLCTITFGMLIPNVQGMLINFSYSFSDSLLSILIGVLFAFLGTAAVIITGGWIFEHLKNGKLAKDAMQNSFINKFIQAGSAMFLNRSIGKQSLWILLIVFLGGIGFVVVLVEPVMILIYAPLFLFVFVPVLYIFLKRMGYLNRIMKQTEDMAAGKLTSVVEVTGKSPLAAHATNLNALRDGVRSSMSEQAKSERMKTELITNVSHDLRTPLTSIITYTDLLKNPDLSVDERMKYVGILDTKSARLKTLIEDLFEVSKMASGNIELVKQRVDLAQLLQQGVAEHEADFTAAGLDLRVNIEEQPIYAYVDGQKWWRVLDNVIVNARKYSLTGTRVYVNLRMVAGEAEFTVKNIASYEMNDDVTELVERFKRGDASRNTDGSGLGLAIAQSIVDLHAGRMKIEVDGDLFKIIVAVQAD